MTTKKPLADALQATIGKYILEEDFNAAKISVSLWKGDVSLYGVRLDVKAINQDFGWEETPDLINVHKDGNSRDSPLSPVKESSFNLKKLHSTKKPHPDSSITTSNKHDSFNNRQDRANYGSRYNEALDQSTETNFSRNETTQSSSGMSYTVPRAYINESWAINVNQTNNFADEKQNMSFLQSLFTSGNNFSNWDFRLPENVQLHSGYIDKIELEIPWSALATKHMGVRITGVKLTFGPVLKRNAPVQSQNVTSTSQKYHTEHPQTKRPSNSSWYGKTPENGNQYQHPNSISTSGGSINSSIVSSVNKVSTHSQSGSNVNVTENIEAKGSTSRQTIGMMLLRSIPYSSHIQREFQKNRRAREEEYVIKRRREVMQTLDQSRRNLKRLRKHLFPMRNSYEAFLDDHMDDDKEKIDNVDGESVNGSKRIPKTSNETFTEKIKRRLVENLHLSISNVHIQYTNAYLKRSRRNSSESHQTDNENDVYVGGIVLDSFTVRTTDEHGRETKREREKPNINQENFFFKAFKILGFGVYIEKGPEILHKGAVKEPKTARSNNDAHSVNCVEDRDSLDQSTTSLFSNERLNLGHYVNYIVNPLTFEAAYRKSDKVLDNNYHNGLENTNEPQHLIFSKLEHLSISVSKSQLRILNDILQNVLPAADNMIKPLFAEYRPSFALTAFTAKEWWKYAVRSVLRMNKKSLWMDFLYAFRKRKKYISLYKRYYAQNHSISHGLSQQSIIPLSSTEDLERRKLEDDRSISLEAIISWRAIAESQFKTEYKSGNNKRISPLNNNVKKWALPTLWGGENNNVLHDSLKSVDQEDLAISYNKMHILESQLEGFDEIKLALESVQVEFEFTLGFAVLVLAGDDQSPVAKFRGEAIEIKTSRLAGGGSTFNFSLNNFYVEDSMTLEAVFPSIFSSIHEDESTSSLNSGGKPNVPAVSVQFTKKNDLDIECHVDIAKFELVYSPPFLKGLSTFFSFDHDSESVHGNFSLQLFQRALNMFSNRVRISFSHIWRQKLKLGTKWKLGGNFHSPIIVFADGDCTNPEAKVVSLILGNQRWSSCSKKRSDNAPSWIKVPSSTMIDSWNIDIDGLTLLTSAAGSSDWLDHSLMCQSSIEYETNSMIEPFSVSMKLGIIKNSVVHSPVPEFNIYFDFNAPSVASTFSPKDLATTLSILMKWSKWGIVRKRQSSTSHSPIDIGSLLEIGNSKSSLHSVESINSNHTLSIEDPSQFIIKGYFILATASTILFSIKMVEGSSINAHILSLAFTSIHKKNILSKMQFGVESFWLYDRTELSNEPKLLVHCPVLPELSSILLDTNPSQTSNILRYLKKSANKDSKESDRLLEISFSSSIGDQSTLDFSSNSISTIDDAAFNLKAKLRKITLHHYSRALSKLNDIWNDISTIISPLLQDRCNFKSGLEDDLSKADSVSTESSLPDPIAVSWLLRIFPKMSFVENVPSHSHLPSNMDVKISLHLESLDFSFHFDNAEPLLDTWAVISINSIQFKLNQQFDNNVNAVLSIDSIKANTTKLEGDLPKHEMFCDGDPSIKFISISFSRSSSRSTKHVDPCKAVTNVNFAPLNFTYSKTLEAFLESFHDDRIFQEIVSTCISSTALLAQDLMWLQRVEQSIRIKIPKPSLRITSDRESNILIVSANSISLNYNHQPYASGGDGELKIKALDFFLDTTESLLQQPIKISVSLFLSPIDDTGNSQVMKVDVYFSDVLLLINRNKFINLLLILKHNWRTFGAYDHSSTDENDNELASLELDSRPTMMSNERQITKKIQIQFKLPLTTMTLSNQTDIESITLKLRAEKLKVLVQCIPCQNFRNIDGKIRHFGIEFSDDSHQSIIRNVFSQIYPDGTDENANIISCHFEEVESVSAKFSLNTGAFQILLTPQIIEEFVLFFNPITIWIGTRDGLSMFPVTRKIDFSISTSICKIIMLESSSSKIISRPWGLAIQGILKLVCELSYNEIENRFNNNTELHITETEVYRAHGGDMSNQIEIFEPFNATFVYCKESQTTDIKVVFLSSIDSVISTNDIFLFFNVYSSVVNALNKFTLDINEANNEEIRMLAPRKRHSGKTHMNLILPCITMVVSDDIQPQDQALFRFSIENLFCDIDIESYPVSCHIRQSILTEYLDSHLNHWKVFSSWCELTINMTRQRHVSKKYCEKTVIEAKVDLQPLSVSVSKELIHKIQSFTDITRLIVNHLSQKQASGNSSSDLGLCSVEHPKTNSSHAIRNDAGVTISFDWGEGCSKECKSGATEYFSFSLLASRGAGLKRVYAQDYMNARCLTIHIHDGCLSTDSKNSFTIDSIDENVNKKRAYKFGRGQVIIVEFLYVENVLLMICRSRILLHNLTKIDFKINVGISEADNDPTLFHEPTSEQQTHGLPQKMNLPIPIYNLSSFDTSNDVSLFVSFATNSHAIGAIPQLEIPSLSKLQKLVHEEKEYSETHLRFGIEENPIGIHVTRIIKHDNGILFVDILLQPVVVILNNLPTPVYIRSYPHGMIQTKEPNNCEQIIRQGSFIELFSLCDQLKIELCIFHGNIAPDNFWNPKGAKDITLNLQKNSAVYPRTDMTVNEVDVQFSEQTEINGGKSSRYFAEEISLCFMSGTRVFSVDASTLLFDYTKKLEVHCICNGIFTRSTTVKDENVNISIFPELQDDLNFDITFRGFDQILQKTMTSIMSVKNIPLSNCISDSKKLKWEDGSNSGYWVHRLKCNAPNFDRIKVISSYAFTNILGFSINLVEEKSMKNWGQIHHGETIYLPLALDSHFTLMIQWCEDETNFHAVFESSNKAGNFSLPLQTASSNADGGSIMLHCSLYEDNAVITYHAIGIDRKCEVSLDPPSKKPSAFNKFFLEVLWKPAIFMRQILVTIDGENNSLCNTRNVEALIFDDVQIAYSQASLDYLNTQFHLKVSINDMKFEEHLPDGSTMVLISKNSSKTPFLRLQFLGEKGPNPPYLRLENLEVNILDDHSNALVFCLDKKLKLADIFDQLCHFLESTLGLKDKKVTGPLYAMMTTVLYLKHFTFSPFNVIVEAKGKYDVNADILPLYLDQKFVEELFRKHRSEFNVSEFSTSSECRVSLSSLLKIILLKYRWRFRKFQFNHNDTDSKLLFAPDMDELITFFQDQDPVNSSVSMEMEENFNQGVLIDFQEMLDLQSEVKKPTPTNTEGNAKNKSRSQKGNGFFFGFGRGKY